LIQAQRSGLFLLPFYLTRLQSTFYPNQCALLTLSGYRGDFNKLYEGERETTTQAFYSPNLAEQSRSIGDYNTSQTHHKSDIAPQQRKLHAFYSNACK